MSLSRLRGFLRAIWLTTFVAATIVVVPVAPVSAALPETQTPVLALDRTIRTSPFLGAAVSMKDNEGSAYVPQDDSLWLASDDGRMVFEVDATSGALKRTYGRTVFENLPQYGGGPIAGVNRGRDFESLAYDERSDVLYLSSGPCCTTDVLPTVFRFQRIAGVLTPVDYQPLPSGSDFTASAWNPADGRVYVGVRKTIQTYDYTTNTLGPTFQVSGLSAITGFEFTGDGRDLFVTRSTTATPPTELLTRVDWATKTMVPGWSFDLTPFGILDARGVALVNGQFHISDGYDFRAAGDPLSHAVFVFDVSASTEPVVAPVAAFDAAPTTGTAPLSVTFKDTSTNKPTGWRWSFGDGSTSTLQNPSPHLYSAPGEYTVTLTVTNAAGSSTASQKVSVVSTAPSASFTASTTSGAAPLAVDFGDTSTGEPTSWAWAFGDGSTSAAQHPSHTFSAPGEYTVTLTVTDAGGGQDTASLVITAQDLSAPVGTFTASPSTITVRTGKTTLQQQSLSDDFTPPNEITRVVDWGDGSPLETWVFGTTVKHGYARVGTYQPTVTLIDRAGNSRTVATNPVTVRAR